MVEYFFYQQ